MAVFAKNRFQVFRVLEARHLDDDAVVALPLDGGLARAELVDALAHDFDRLIDDVLLGLRLVGVGHLQGENALAVIGKIIGALADREHAAADRRVQAFQQRLRIVAARGIANLHRHGVRRRVQVV